MVWCMQVWHSGDTFCIITSLLHTLVKLLTFFVAPPLAMVSAMPYMQPTGASGVPVPHAQQVPPNGRTHSSCSLTHTPSATSTSAPNPMYPTYHPRDGFRKPSTTSAGGPNSEERQYFELIRESSCNEGKTLDMDCEHEIL